LKNCCLFVTVVVYYKSKARAKLLPILKKGGRKKTDHGCSQQIQNVRQAGEKNREDAQMMTFARVARIGYHSPGVVLCGCMLS
jgi:hypothetical protein